MRALIIGIGGAGCRIAEMMNLHEKGSKVHSIRTFIFDSDRSILKNKSSIDPDHRIILSPFDVSGELDPTKLKHGTDFDVSCIATVFQDAAVDEVDAIFVIAGLGGRMAEAVPDIIKQLNEAFADPVFAILTLPARSEGARVSALASQELEDIREVCSSSILFDNETWIQRLEELRATEISRAKEKEGKGDVVPRQSIKLPIREVYGELNELLVRRIELLIRAGEITEKGIEVAEAVLDAGEVLNTLRDTDIVSIGYASVALPKTPHGIFKFFVSTDKENSLDTGTERTARIVELAKRAVYEEVSIPCDLTSADRALVLITGPSEELSMKGFQTVRKWVDRSIKGLEMRAGDYPVHSVRNVAIVIVLAGIENVPRITELNSIRNSYQNEVQKVYPGAKKVTTVINPSEESVEDKDIFEEEAECFIGSNNNALPPAANTDDDDDFWIDSAPEKKPEPKLEPEPVVAKDEGDDIFEDNIIVQPHLPQELPPAAPVFIAAAAAPSVRFVQEQRVTPEPAPARYYAPYNPEPMKEVKQERVKDPQITLGGAKKAVKKTETDFFLPKREKKEDMVLHGQADIGANDKPRDVEAVSHIGGAMRPKEVEGVTSIGSRQRPRENDSGVSVGLRQRPREIGGAVQISTGQRPKEIDGVVGIASAQRPKEIDGVVHIASAQRPKEIGGAVHISTGQRPKEIDGAAVRMASAQRPKEIGGAVHISTAQKPKEIGNEMRVASAQKPKEFGDVRMASAQRPKEIGNEMRVASAQKPKEFGDVRMANAQRPKEIGNDIRVLPADKRKQESETVKAGSKPTEDKYAEKRGIKWK